MTNKKSLNFDCFLMNMNYKLMPSFGAHNLLQCHTHNFTPFLCNAHRNNESNVKKAHSLKVTACFNELPVGENTRSNSIVNFLFVSFNFSRAKLLFGQIVFRFMFLIRIFSLFSESVLPVHAAAKIL